MRRRRSETGRPHDRRPQILDGLADFHYFAHEFMAENIARLHCGNQTVIEMQVGAADSGACDLDDGVPGVQESGVGHMFHLHIVLVIPTDGLHDGPFFNSKDDLLCLQDYRFTTGLTPGAARRLTFGCRNFSRLHHLFKAAEVLRDLLFRRFSEEFGECSSDLACRRIVPEFYRHNRSV